MEWRALEYVLVPNGERKHSRDQNSSWLGVSRKTNVCDGQLQFDGNARQTLRHGYKIIAVPRICEWKDRIVAKYYW